MKYLRILLYPISIVYDLVTQIRNFLFDKQWFLQSTSFDIPVISIGNLTVGGTGKTPMIEFLIRNLQSSYKIGVLSRGYGRTTKGFFAVNETSTAHIVGDEPYQMFSRFKKNAAFFVCENRVKGINEILKTGKYDLILLDDAFQHRYVKPSYSILLTDYNRLFTNDLLLPTGLLRESRMGAKRANCVIVTKCPTLTNIQKEKLNLRLKPYLHAGTNIHFSTIEYKSITIIKGALTAESNIVLLTGIANPKPFIDYVSSKYRVTKTYEFPDHHNYTNLELSKISMFLKTNTSLFLLTTEKDYQRLSLHDSIFENLNFGYLPIETEIQTKHELLLQLKDSIWQIAN